MDFFARQDRSRRLSLLLSIYFVGAVCAILAALNVLPFLLLNHFYHPTPRSFIDWMSAEGLMLSIGSLSVFAYGSWRRRELLADGSSALVLQIGGQVLDRASRDRTVIRLLHVTEEMSIASGVPMPSIAILEEESGLNAFVAGSDARDANLVVTRGLLSALSRAELQAVVAHEFSHIANNDMQLNSRIIIMLGGIMMLGSAGRRMLYLDGSGQWTRRSSKNRLGFIPLGILFVVAGWLGTMLGRLIHAAICRQREYLSDASAVQYTRAPGELASALHRLLSSDTGTRLRRTALAGELNHMCIGESIGSGKWFASHPPLANRIDAVDSSFFRGLRVADNQKRLRERRARKAKTPPPAWSTQRPERISDRVGQWGSTELIWARSLRHALVTRFGDRLDTVDGASSLLIELFEQDFAQLDIPGLAEGARLPLIEWLTRTLKSSFEEDRSQLIKLLELRISDRQKRKNSAALAGICYLMYLQYHLLPTPVQSRPRVNRYDETSAALGELLSLFCRLGAGATAIALFQTLETQWFPLNGLKFSSRTGAASLTTALAELDRLPSLLKPAIIDACAAAVRHDGRIAVAEFELLRISCELLACPLPPDIDRDYLPTDELTWTFGTPA